MNAALRARAVKVGAETRASLLAAAEAMRELERAALSVQDTSGS